MDGKPSLYEITLPVVSFQVTCRAPATRMGWLAKLAPGQEWLVEERYNLCSIILLDSPLSIIVRLEAERKG